MKYVIAFYNDLLHDPANRVPFGAVVTDGSRLLFDFDTTDVKGRKIKSKSAAFDPFIFGHFKDTFQTNYVDVGVAYTTDENGQTHTIDVHSEDFLDYLARNSQGAYQYSVPQSAEGEEPESVLNLLMQRIQS